MNKKGTKIKISDIAVQAGLSVTSVSKVLNAPHLTRESTQQKVNKAIAFLRSTHRKNSQTFITRAGQHKFLIIDNQQSCESLINRGIEDKIASINGKLLYLRFSHLSLKDIQQVIGQIVELQVDGIIIINSANYLMALKRYIFVLPPIVLVNQFSLDMPCLCFDHLSIGYHATKYLIEKGHQKIAILSGTSSNTQYLIQGYTKALQQSNIEQQPLYVLRDCVDFLSGVQAIKSLMKQSLYSPTAIICTDNLCATASKTEYTKTESQEFTHLSGNYPMLSGVLHQCRMMRIAIPDDLSILYFSHTNIRQYNELDLLDAIYKPLYKMGQQAVDLMMENINSPLKKTQTQLMMHELLKRNSVKSM